MARGSGAFSRDEPKRRDERWETLKRRVQLLARLDGPTLGLAEGLHVVRVDRVGDAQRVIARLREQGGLDRATFESTIVSERPALHVTRELLATAQRDLRALATPPVRAQVREHRRALVRWGEIDEAWLETKRKRVAILTALLAERRDRASDWFDGVLEIARAVHGEASAIALDEARVRLTALGAERRRVARERVEALALAVEIGAPPSDPDLAPLVERLDRARDLPGRARRSRVLDVLRRAIAWPEAPASAVHDLAAPLRDRTFGGAVRAAGCAMIQALPAARDPEVRERTLQMLAHYGLLFRVGDDGVPLMASEDVTKAVQRRAEATAIAGAKVTLAQAIAIVDLPFENLSRKLVAGWVADGLEIDLAREACKLGHAENLARAANARAARAYATWVTKLVPHYRALGINFDVSPDLFAHLPRNEDVALLAVCLMESSRDETAAKDPIAVLDATLGMFQKLPAKARGILARLEGTTHGAGRRAFPELAAWLADDALLDRFVHLSGVAGAPVALTKQLREDFEHADKAARERAHLETLSSRSSRQEARLAVLRAGDRSRAAAPRARTKRRLKERIDELLPIAYRRELDGAFRDILREAWSITVPKLTEAWRDAVRFWLVVDENRDLLGQLLRAAAASPGRDVKQAFRANRAWCARVDGEIRVGAWLAPRRVDFVVDGAKHTLAVEEDPLEVLRMGIPFGTCLALDTGCNAAATVLNALDANKRVLYVRTREGKIVARKLIAISRELRLVGYNLYVSARGDVERAVRSAVESMCRTIAEETGAPFASAGVPDELHEGFWYDDGTRPWGEDVDVASYCRALELDPPAEPFDALATEARGHAAIDAGDVDAAAAVLTQWDCGPANVALGRWVVERLGVREAERRARAREDSALATAILRTLATRDEDGMLRALATATRFDERSVSSVMNELLAAFPRSDRLARAAAEMAVRALRAMTRADDHGLVHGTMGSIPALLGSVAASFDVLDRADVAWAGFVAAMPSCKPCRATAWWRAAAALLEIFARAPDPDAVVACMMSRHRSEASQRAALVIAARHQLPNGARGLARLGTLRPGLATTPEMLTARLHQEGIDTITESLARKLPRPDAPPFEALAEKLFEIPGIDRLLERWPEGSVEAWSPTPWELAYFRRRPRARVRDALFDVASRSPGVATRAMELLASLGDLERIEALRVRATERRPEKGPKPHEARTWKTPLECGVVVQAVMEQIAHVSAGRLPPRVGRRDVIDRALVSLAIRSLRDRTRPAEERDVAARILASTPDRSFELVSLLVDLARAGDAAALEPLLREKLDAASRLPPEATVEVWQVEGARAALAESFVKNAGDDWCARVTACERAAEAAGESVDGLFEEVARRLIEGEQVFGGETETLDQLRTVVRIAVTECDPIKAVALYGELSDELSASLFIKAVRRLGKRDPHRAAALRDALSSAHGRRFLGGRGAARKAWLESTRSLKNRRSSSTERE
ncbi:MAG: hypothetical protein KF819_28690 [Labilithrix sp.]|nr:hypothetical protein [Labilithrix sp.]